MQLLFPTRLNSRKDNAAGLEDFQPIRKAQPVDLRYANDSRFIINSKFIKTLKDDQGWTCSIDESTGKVYLVRVEDHADIVPRFCVKKDDKKRISNTFKAEVLQAALKADGVTNYMLHELETQPIEGVTLFEVIEGDADGEFEDEVEVEAADETVEVTAEVPLDVPVTFEKVEEQTPEVVEETPEVEKTTETTGFSMFVKREMDDLL